MCEHKRLTYVGQKGITRVFCADCGKELDKSFLEGKNSAKKPVEEAKQDKTAAKKRTAKKAV